MELGTVDELIQVLGLARQEARRPVDVARADRRADGIVREIAHGSSG